ncbi:hypothetical protein [Halotia branconii]|uniref:DUF3040 domain-containing protein n=1 Tax=Halotia branconii CENA392 TaxID=1539056 RepID=A0AAJ6PCI2_9CYAN|nr:hypothetical protein [Halotia branconii]WGV28887.1 hypothetical protein QI031_21585 [Halotia branconii CENA392]
MTSQGDRYQELEQQERILREREVELRLRKMEADIHIPNASIHQTIKHQPENSSQPWMKKVILGGKLFALGVAALVAVRIASVLAGILIVAVLVGVSYKLFFESKNHNF